jgi:hypothetical protein
MSEQLATFFNAKIGASNYLVLITNNSAFDIEIRKALLRHVPKFGATVAEKARISTIHDGSERRAYGELLQKHWPKKVHDSLTVQNSPFLVLINKDFSSFDPQHDDWFIIWLIGLGRPKHAIPMLFDKLTRVIVADGDLFEFLQSKTEAPGGIFGNGTIWSRQHFDDVPGPVRRGRPAIVTDELLRKLDKLIINEPHRESRWQNFYATEAQKWLAKHGQIYPTKSVRDALRKAGWFHRADYFLFARDEDRLKVSRKS